MDSGYSVSLGKELPSAVAFAEDAQRRKLPEGIPSPSPLATKPRPRSLPLKSLNHVSVHCRDVEESIRFYRDLMGFVLVKRPTCLDYFDGAWLFNYGIGIHLLKDDAASDRKTGRRAINPRSDHVSFQCEDVEAVVSLLNERGVPYVRQQVVEHGIVVEQLFFHDPDDHMIEICNCDALPVEPIGSPRTSATPEYLPPLQSVKSSPGVVCSSSSSPVGSCSLKRVSQSLPGSPPASLSSLGAIRGNEAAQMSAEGQGGSLIGGEMRKRKEDDVVKRQVFDSCHSDEEKGERGYHGCVEEKPRSCRASLASARESDKGAVGDEEVCNSECGEGSVVSHYGGDGGEGTRLPPKLQHQHCQGSVSSPAAAARRASSGSTAALEMKSFMPQSPLQVSGLC